MSGNTVPAAKLYANLNNLVRLSKVYLEMKTKVSIHSVLVIIFYCTGGTTAVIYICN